MNHIYRIVWNHATACYQAVTERAKGQGKVSGKCATTVQNSSSRTSQSSLQLTATALGVAFAY